MIRATLRRLLTAVPQQPDEETLRVRCVRDRIMALELRLDRLQAEADVLDEELRRR